MVARKTNAVQSYVPIDAIYSLYHRRQDVVLIAVDTRNVPMDRATLLEYLCNRFVTLYPLRWIRCYLYAHADTVKKRLLKN